MNPLTKQDIFDLLFHDGLWESRVVNKRVAAKLRELDSSAALWHCDLENVTPPSRGDGVTIWQIEAWQQNSLHREELKENLEFEKFKLERRSEHVRHVRVKLIEKFQSEKLADTFINRGLFPQDDKDREIQQKLKLDYVEVDNKSEELWQTNNKLNRAEGAK